jgi:hypothetical protein
MNTFRVAGSVFVALMLVDCSSQRFSFGDQASMVPVQDMTGRWILTAPNAPSCGMNFSGASGAREGPVLPEGGCPDKFFMSRRWAFEQDALVINDEDNAPLAQLKFAGDRFTGQSAAGTPVTLVRQMPTVN